MNKLIVNADDFGLSQSVNMAIANCFNIGLINQTTIMVNMPFYEDAVILSKDYGFFNKVGIHLNLDFGRPLTSAIRKNMLFCDESGEFNGCFKEKLLNNIWLSNQDRLLLQAEIAAQFEKYVNSGFTLMHFDSHHNNHNRYSILKAIIPIAKSYGFRSTRKSRNLFKQKPPFYTRIYKYFINYLIASNFETRMYFGGYTDYIYRADKSIDMDVEIMLHPDIINEKLVDVINKNHYRDLQSYDFLKV